jgi:[acyl-carrier-protein] S-malonyltransferase
MAKDLAERFPAAREALQAVDDALGTPLSRLMFEGPEDELTATHNAQPAILAHTAAVFAVVSTRPGVGWTAGAVGAAGHSLGEYSAYLTARSLDLAAAAKLVRRRGELMQKAGTERPGTMAAVLGLASGDVEAACSASSRAGEIVVAANMNAPDQTVISGDEEAVTRAGQECKKRGAKRVMPLKVSGAFHSPLMGPAVNHLNLALERSEFRDPVIPVVANATAEVVKDASRARRLLVDQLTAPVRWVDCVRRLAGLAGEEGRFVEIGPGGVLGGLVQRIVPNAQVTSLATADEVEKFLEAA